jgi:CHAD domain-containing protein
MPTRLPRDLLDRSAPESSRLLALDYLDQIDRAQRQLSDPQDGEALHDFRVGLRRLRSCVRAYRAQLKGSVSGKLRDRLRELTRATNAGRDTEVQLTWLRKQAERMGSEETKGFFWFTGRLEGHKLESLDPATAEIARRYSKLASKLRKRLGILRIEVGNDPAKKPATFGQITGELIRQQVIRLQADLVRVRDVLHVDEAHRARIGVKRLRYLLEPVARRNRRARALIPRLKEAQDLLGEHHDMYVLAGAVTAARPSASGNDGEAYAALQRGLETLERLAGEQALAAFERFQSLWEGEAAGRVLRRVDEIGRSLEEGPAPVAHGVAALHPASTNGDAATDDGKAASGTTSRLENVSAPEMKPVASSAVTDSG